ncbi:MAG: cyclic nucleotide-binding domain-containing protein, partial [Anaerolineales bacterium]
MDVLEVLGRVELFEGLSPNDLEAVARICHPRTFRAGDIITRQGDQGSELFIVSEGLVEVVRDNPGDPNAPHAVVNLGRGQIFGEMSLVDRGPRSASVRSVGDDTLVQVLRGEEFDRLCR